MRMTMLPKPFLHAKYIIETIEEHGYEAYFVGGCVRDVLLNRPITDIDITTSATPDRIQNIFPKVIPVGIEHGTVIVRHEKQSYEVTTFRVDGTYSDQRHPDSVQFIRQLDRDLKRRDFTINALAMNKKGKVIDLFAGQKDIENKLIRTVGNGVKRFTEDPLRIIRALRFSSQLGFSIERETLEAMKQVMPQIESIAVERITNEMEKLFSGRHVQTGLHYLKETKVHQHLPIMLDYPYIIYDVPKEIKPLHSFGQVIALFHHLEPEIPVDYWIKEWKCSNQTKNEAHQLTKALTDYGKNGLSKWLIYRLNSAYHNGFINLTNMIYSDNPVHNKEIEKLTNDLPIRSRRDLALNGYDLIQMFPHAKKGPWLQQTLTKLEREVVEGNVLNKKFSLKEWIRCNPPEIN